METMPEIAAEEALRRVIWTLRRADMAVHAVRDPELRAAGLPPAHYSLLAYVHTYPGLTGAELARRSGVSAQAVALLATKLEAKGLLERRIHPRHRNVQEFHLTPAGLDALRVGEAVTVALEQRVRTALGPERSQQLRDLLDEVISLLGAGADERQTL
jgi:DNA-binding MarR family transcriptional regulator